PWPSVREVRIYRDKVRNLVDSVIATLDFTLPIAQESPMWIILMGIEHERIHIETSSVLHRQMDIKHIKHNDLFMACEEFTQAPTNEMVSISGGEVVLGKEKNHPLYGWDNEYGTYKENIKEFLVSKYLVSNSEYMEFVQEGGYSDTSYWDEEGLEFLKITSAKHPPFWVAEDGMYRYRTLTKIIDLPLSWPAEVNALEAMAFCRYKSKKDGVTYTLPSEAEFRALYEYAELEDIPELDDDYANINFNHFFSSCPVDKFMFKGLGDVIGNVWQWSRTPIFGFDGFDVHPAYDDFSTPTFDCKHAIICGGSWASSGNLIMKHSRYAFRRHFYQHAGFRYVVSDTKSDMHEDIYESDALVSQYCEFQYGEDVLGVKNFAVACAAIAAHFSEQKTKALDLGCATGRASFELAKTFESVEGIDFSVRFVGVGTKLKSDGYIGWSKPQEGELIEKKKITLKQLGYNNIAEKVQFWQGDACNLKPNFTGYDLVMATNLIDRLYQPKLFLEEIKNRINEGGILMITSPYTWQESSTAKEFWLGGYKDESGKEIKTLETLKEILGNTFELIHLENLPFVIAESARKHQYTIAEVSVWRRK
ncbi:MAG: 5-histidylcysteine sulfoxide synthase, partial [Sulfurimonadaceae bacterium]|nr:5-histidylcysteine sulfoxide synthase [Sulfurimonadaceae bacterium]